MRCPDFIGRFSAPARTSPVDDRAGLSRETPSQPKPPFRAQKDLIRQTLETIQKVNKMKFDNSIVQTTFHSPLGEMIIAATDKGLAGVWFAGQRHLPPQLVKPYVWREDPEHPVLRQTIAQLTEYYAGTRTEFDLPLDLGHGTAFQQSVWQALLAIPQGDTLSYGQVSQRIGKPEAVRAVGAAVGRNPVSVIVPCHRVLGADGSLTGYAGGLHRKTALLKLEGALQENML